MNENAVPRRYRYFVLDRNGTFLGEWTDVTDDFEHTDEINTLGGAMVVHLGRSIRNNVSSLSYLLTESGDYLCAEDGSRLVMDIAAAVQVGDGTDVADGNYVRIYEYYGSTSYLTTESGDYLTTEDGFRLLTESGPLDGRRIFSGSITQWEVIETPERDAIAVTLTPLSADFGSLIYENLGWAYLNSLAGAPGLSYADLVKANGTDTFGAVQVFTAPATGPYLQVIPYFRFPADVYLTSVFTITLALYTGSDPNGSRSLLYTYNLTTNYSSWAGQTVGLALWIGDGPQLTSGSSYHFELSVNQDRTPGGNAPVQLVTTTSSTIPGAFWTKAGVATTYTHDTSRDWGFEVQVLTSRAIEATYTGWTVSDFVDQTVDLVAQRAGRTGPNNSSDGTAYIENPGITLPPTTLTGNTFKDRLDVALKAAPAGWYYRYDHASNRIVFRARHTSADHIFRAGVHLQDLDVLYDTEGIVNIVYVLGGPYPTDTDPRIERRYVDQTSVNRYGPKSRFISDSRLTDPTSVDLRGNYELLSNKDPKYQTTITIIDTVYDTGSIFVGDTVGFNGFGTFKDTLILQVMRKSTMRGKVRLTLGTLPPTERNRLADMKAQLDQLNAADSTGILL